MTSKPCFKCHAVLPLAEFYKHGRMADGHLNKCKACTRREALANRAAKLGYYQAYDRVRYVQHGERDTRPKELRREHARGRKRTYNADKRYANNAVQYALRRGSLKRPGACTDCQRTDVRLHAHHDDYSKPLQVAWVCPKCHGARHRRHPLQDDLAVLAAGRSGPRADRKRRA
jgi:hypothetical protein